MNICACTKIGKILICVLAYDDQNNVRFDLSYVLPMAAHKVL